MREGLTFPAKHHHLIQIALLHSNCFLTLKEISRDLILKPTHNMQFDFEFLISGES